MTTPPKKGFNFKPLAIKVKEVVKTFVDPLTVTEDDPSTAEALFEDVRFSRPPAGSLFNGPLGQVRFENVPETKPEGIGLDDEAKIECALLVWIPGNSDKSVLDCYHSVDVAGGYFEDMDLLELPGYCVERPKDSNPFKFININVSDNAKNPLYYTLGRVFFILYTPWGDLVTEL